MFCPAIDTTAGVICPAIDTTAGVICPAIDTTAGVICPAIDTTAGVICPAIDTIFPAHARTARQLPASRYSQGKGGGGVQRGETLDHRRLAWHSHRPLA